MTSAHDEIVRNGFHLTRQHWQHYDRLNVALNGKLVVVQGGRSGAPDSGTTHLKLGVVDYRRWNLNSAQAAVVVHHGRDLCGATWERFPWQGFDPHFHECLLGDDLPGLMDPVAIGQCVTYKAGGDGVAGTAGDTNPYRPVPIRNYVFLEDDMDDAEHKELFRIGRALDAFRVGEVKRDQAEADRDKARFTAMVTQQGEMVDMLTVLINNTKDAATKQQLRQAKERILLWLKNNQDVTGVDNPDDSQMP